MKKTQLKDGVRNIRKQIVSYISIILIAMIGVTAFLSIDYSANAMRVNTSEIYNDRNFRDIEIVSTLLFTEEDFEEIKKTEGVADAEAVRYTSAKAAYGEKRESVNVISTTQRINAPGICEGRLPETTFECAVEQSLADKLGLRTDDKIKVTGGSGDPAEFLPNTDYTVVGIVIHPDHINKVVPESPYVMVCWDAFGSDDLENCFMKTEIIADRSPDVFRFSDDYKKTVSDLTDRIKELAAVREGLRNKTVFYDSYDEIDKNQKLLDEAEKKLADARAELDEKTEEYNLGVKEADDAEKQLNEAKPLLEEGWIQLEAVRLQLEDGKAELDAGKIKLDDGKTELDLAKKTLDFAKTELADGYKRIEDGKARIRGVIKAAYELAFVEDSERKLIIWADIHEADVDDPSENASYLWITENTRIDLSRPLEDFFSAVVYAKSVPEELLVALYDSTQGGKASPKKANGEYDYDAIRQALVNTAVNNAGDYKTLADACVQWNEGHDQYIEGLEKYRTGLIEYEAGKKQLEDAEQKYNDGLKAYQDGLEEYNDRKNQFDAASKELAEGRKKLAEGKTLLEEGEAKYKDGIAEAEEGKAKLQSAKDKLSELDLCSWLTFDLNGNASFVQLRIGSENVLKIKTTFALLFIVVGSLVIFATVGKMVDEQRSLIGAQKALGFFNREIFVKYLIFGVSATAIGTVLGIITSRFAIEQFLLSSFGIYYYYDISKILIVTPLPTVAVFVCGTLLSAVSVFLASTRLLREPAVRLMQPKAPGYKKGTGGKSKLPLYSRLILLNMKTDIKRVMVTVVSVAGCCALIVVGVTLKTSINAVPDLQYGGITAYDLCVKYDPKINGSARSDIENTLKDSGAQYTNVYNPVITYKAENMETAELFCGDITEINGFYHLNNVYTGKPLYPTNEGVLIQKRMMERYGLYQDSEIEIAINGTKTATVRVAGIFESYFGSMMVMSPQYYESMFDGEYTPNAYLVKLNGADAEKLTEKLLGSEGVESVSRADSGRNVLATSSSSVDFVALLFIFIAAVMAGVVLMNLTNIYIMQKKRELVIMRVNGFTTAEVIGYVLRETVFTTAVGIIVGIGVGSVVVYSIIRMLEQTMIQFDRRVNPVAWLIAAALTVLFTVIVNMIALRKVKHLKLTDI